MNTAMTEAEVRRFFGFLQRLRRYGRKEKTIESYTSAHRVLCEFFAQRDGVGCEWTQITGLDLREWKSAALKAGAQAATINHRLVFAKAYSTFLRKEGAIPAEQLESLRAITEVQMPQLGAKVLEPDEYRRFMRNVELTATKRDKALIYLLLSGLREGEVVGLRRDDVQLSAQRGSVRIHGEHVKTSAYRVVPLGRQARIHLQAYLADTPELGAVFFGERGPLTEDGVYKVVRKYGEQVGLRTFPHLFRHEFAAIYLRENQNDLTGLQALLGHAQLDTTARFYARKRMTDLEANVEKISI